MGFIVWSYPLAVSPFLSCPFKPTEVPTATSYFHHSSSLMQNTEIISCHYCLILAPLWIVYAGALLPSFSWKSDSCKCYYRAGIASLPNPKLPVSTSVEYGPILFHETLLLTSYCTAWPGPWRNPMLHRHIFFVLAEKCL